MNSTGKLVVLALGLAAVLAACDDDPELPPKPDLPPQIGISKTYTQAANGLASNDVYSILVLSNGEFWIGTAAGISRYANVSASARTGDIINGINGLPHPQVRKMIEYNNKVYVATWGGGIGIYDIAGGTWTQIRPSPAANGLRDGFVADLAASPTEDRVYLATNDGVSILNPATSTFTHFNTVDPDYIEREDTQDPPLTAEEKETMALQRLVSAVSVVELAGVVERWYGPRVEVRPTAAQEGRLGVLVSKPATEYRYTTTNSGLIQANVNSIYYDTVNGTFWVAYVSEGLSEVNTTTKTWTDHTLVQGLPSNTIGSITRATSNAGENEVIWAATNDGLARLNGDGTWQAYGVSGGLPSNRPRIVYSDDGQRLWVGFVDAGVVRISN